MSIRQSWVSQTKSLDQVLMIPEREREIIQTLADKVIEKENEIEELLKGIGELDWSAATFDRALRR